MDNQNLIQRIDELNSKIEELETLEEDLTLELLKIKGEYYPKGMEYINKPDNINNDYAFGEENLRYEEIIKEIISKLEMTKKLILEYKLELARLKALL